MKTPVVTSLVALSLLLAGPALASDKCKVPQDQWQAKDALQKKLEEEGWKVSRIKIDDGCYEVYGTDGAGKRAEVYFDPKTFAEVKS